jgi:acyl phosphate:glycerol-3-phosphate acyltransferase
MDWKVWLIPLLAYLVGSFPTGVVISRKKFGIDVRDMGSGNIGATNITRNFGWRAGVITFLIDFMKGYLGLKMAEAWYPEWPWVATCAGAAVVLGHCFSAFLRLRGGKGVATTLGCFAAMVPWVAALMATSYLILLAITRVSAIGSLVGIALSCGAVSILPTAPAAKILVYLCSAIVLVRHQSNVRRLIVQQIR